WTVGHDLHQRDHQIGADHIEAAVRQIHDARHAEDQRHPDRDEEQEHPDAEAAHHLHGDERPIGDPGEQAREVYFFFSAAAARSFVTSSQLFTSSLPWTSSMSPSTGLPWAFILIVPIHWGGMACWSQPRMMTLPHGKSIS